MQAVRADHGELIELFARSVLCFVTEHLAMIVHVATIERLTMIVWIVMIVRIDLNLLRELLD